MNNTVSILVVSADEHVCAVFERLLASDIAANFSIAASVNEGRERCVQHRPNVMVLDQAIATDGLASLVREFVSEDSQILIIIVGVKGREREVIEAFKAGASEVVHRPLKLTEIKEIISRTTGVIARRQYDRFAPDLFELVRLELNICASTKAVSKAVAMLSGYVGTAFVEREVLRLELGLQEVLRNALEHGCLGVDYEDKKKMCETGTFDDFVESESSKAREAGKLIYLKAALTKGEFCCVIRDSGNGFNWRKAKERLVSAQPEELCTGRGIFLIERVFDKVTYNDVGNEITLVKRLAQK